MQYSRTNLVLELQFKNVSITLATVLNVLQKFFNVQELITSSRTFFTGDVTSGVLLWKATKIAGAGAKYATLKNSLTEIATVR